MMNHRSTSSTPVLFALTLAVGLLAVPSPAAEWSLELQPVLMEVYGHDRHVLTTHSFDLTSFPRAQDQSAVRLDTDQELVPRFTVERRAEGKWGFGFDFMMLLTSQSTPLITDSGSSALSPVSFEIADDAYTSTGPSEILYYRTLEDTDLEMWTADLYATRSLAGSDSSDVWLILGLRTADFDNDYRAVVGKEDVGGTRVDASSNYGAMHGPLVGIAGDVRRGKNTLSGSLSQSLVFGEAELAATQRQYLGPSAAFSLPLDEITVPPLTRSSIRSVRDTAIPISEARIRWDYQATGHLSFGAGVESSVWWNVPVPPGAIAGEAADAFYESTIVLFGLAGSVKFTF